MNLERVERDLAELGSWNMRMIDVQLLAISRCESLLEHPASKRARADLGEVALVAWGALDEAHAIRRVYERAAMVAELEGPGRTPAVVDLLERWRGAARRAEVHFLNYLERWSAP